ncbi:MAG: carbon-nitrogen hydrolase family protein [Rhizobiaceae bacterium]|nr:carbon-nitrogen hydrolase family protein [Rhizobiaceae bacterium]
MKTVRIAAAQTPEFREDIEGAVAYAVDVAAQTHAEGARLICFPEAFLQGYLLDQQRARRCALDVVSEESIALAQRFPASDQLIVLGMIEADHDRLFNSAVVIRNRTIIGRYRKRHLLAGEAIFDPGSDAAVFDIDGLRFGINICYDSNFPEAARKIADLGASLIVCLANNMMRRDRAEEFRDRHNVVRGDRCRETGLWLISSDITGEREGRVCWGPTAVLSPQGQVVAQLPLERPGLLIFDIPQEPER